MKNILITLILALLFSTSCAQTKEQIEDEIKDISKSWIRALYTTENPEGGVKYNDKIISVSIYPDYIAVNAKFSYSSLRFGWSVPSLSYIKVKGSSKKYKLHEVYQSYRSDKLDKDVSYYEKGGFLGSNKRWSFLTFSFIFEKIPSGITEIDVFLEGKEVYLGGYPKTKRWKDIYSNFKNVKITNPPTPKKRVPKSNY